MAMTYMYKERLKAIQMFNQLVYITTQVINSCMILNEFDQSVYTYIVNTKRYTLLFNIIGGFDR